MITVLDSVQWAPSDLTGNGVIFQNGDNVLVVGSARVDGKTVIYQSSDIGRSFTKVYEINSGVGASNPAVAQSGGPGSDLYVAMYVRSSSYSERAPSYDLVLYKVTLEPYSAQGPYTIIEGSIVQSGFDVAVTSTGKIVVAVSTQNATAPNTIAGLGYKFSVLTLNSDYSLATTDVLYTAPARGGETIGSVSIIPGTAGAVELYYTAHLKSRATLDKTVFIRTRTHDSFGIWHAPVEIAGFTARSTDDKLTVITNGSSRFVSQGYWVYLPDKLALSGSVMYGYAPTGADWSTWTLVGTETDSYTEPTLSTDGSGTAYLSLLKHNVINNAFSRTGKLAVYSVDTSIGKLTRRVGAFENLRFRWLRGGVGPVDTTSKWMVVGEQGSETTENLGGFPTFVSEFNTAPVVTLHPQLITIVRGTQVLLDGSDTYDPDQDVITYTWSHDSNVAGIVLTPSADGRTATLLVPKSVGPAAFSFTVTLSCSDGKHAPVLATSAITVPFNAAPTISFNPNPVNVTRNTTVTITPIVADVDNQDLTYQWTQIDGSIIPVQGVQSKTARFPLYRLGSGGETLTFRCEVSDGINAPVGANVDIIVPPLGIDQLDHGKLYRTFFSVGANRAKIADRNTDGSWGTLVQSAITTDFFKFKLSRSTTNDKRYTYISRQSVVVYQEFGHANILFRRDVAPPNSVILDAIHTETDSTYVLLEDQRTLKYKTAGTAGISDWPDATIKATVLENGPYSNITSSNAIVDRRVLAYWGDHGLILVMIQESTAEVLSTYRMSVADNNLYGADAITFVRLAEVESITSGRVLVGSTVGGEAYETMIDLRTKRVIGTWDKSQLLSRHVVTGEILDDAGSGYIGKPLPPLLHLVNQTGSVINFAWDQARADLIQSYEISVSVDGLPPTVIGTILNGFIREFTFRGVSGHLYGFTVKSINQDGTSDPSQPLVVTVS